MGLESERAAHGGASVLTLPPTQLMIRAMDLMYALPVRDRVEGLLFEESPKALCDDCITEILGLTIRQHANQKTRELAERADFHRREAACSRCQKLKLVISHA